MNRDEHRFRTRRLGDSIGKVYGWSFPRPKRKLER